MLLFNAHKKNQGFTLIETTIILVIVGILSAIAAPSFLSMFNKNKVNNALVQLQGTLQEAQIEAIRKGKQCTVTIDTTNKKLTTSSSCVVTGDRQLKDGVAIATNISSSTITFGIRGNTSVTLPAGAAHAKIALYMSDSSTQQKKCLAISNGIGIMRTGDYSGSTASASDITAGDCTTPTPP